MDRNRRDDQRWTGGVGGHADKRNIQPLPPPPPPYSGNSNRNVRNSIETGKQKGPNSLRTDQQCHHIEAVDQHQQPQDPRERKGNIGGAPCIPPERSQPELPVVHDNKNLRICPPLEDEKRDGNITELDNLSYHHKRMGRLLAEQISSSNKMLSSLKGLEEVNKQLETDKKGLEQQVQKLETENTEQSRRNEQEVAAWKEKLATLKTLLAQKIKAAESHQQNIDKLEETVKEMKNAEKLCKEEMENLRQKNEQQIREAELAETKYKEKVTAFKKLDDAYLALKNAASRKEMELNNATKKWKHFEEAAVSYQMESENLKATNDKLEKENQKIKNVAEQLTRLLKSVSLEKDKLFLEKIKNDETGKRSIEILRKKVNDLAGQLKKEKTLKEEMLDDYTTKVLSPSLLNKMVHQRTPNSISPRQSLAETPMRKRKSCGSGDNGEKKKKDAKVGKIRPGRQEDIASMLMSVSSSNVPIKVEKLEMTSGSQNVILWDI